MNTKYTSRLNRLYPPGFSLVEVMIGMTLFSIVALGAFKCLGDGYAISKKRIDNDLANHMIQEEMEYLRSLTFTEISALSPEESFHQTPEQSHFKTSRLISSRNGRPDQKIIKISISWDDARGHNHAYSCISFFTQNGI